MIAHTKAFTAYKKQSTELLDFAVLVCYAIPEFQQALLRKLKDPNVVLAQQDHFGGTHDPAQLQKYARKYRSDLAIHVILSAFALLDGYFQEACGEVLAFHGGAKGVADRVTSVVKRQNSALAPAVEENLAKLREYPKKSKRQKYSKAIESLREAGHVLPSFFFAAHGVLSLNRMLARHRLTASQIPDVMEECFCFELGPKKVDYERIRKLRNVLAHSKRATCDLATAMADARLLRDLVVAFDKHLVRNILVIESA